MVSTGKLVAGIATVGAVGGGAGAIYHFTKETKIETTKDRLTKAGYEVLNVESDEGWDAVLTAYKLIDKQDEIFSGSVIKEETKPNLKQKCRVALSSNKEYELASRWCVKEQTIEQMLTSNKYTKLIKNGSTGYSKSKWTTKLSKLESIPEANRGITVTLSGDETNKLKALETFCTDLKIDTLKTHEDKDFEKKFSQAKEWCSEKLNN